ncbi:CDP-glycerol glycerophosphotransferase family protein [Leucobacter aridicollis]|uniref:CDP-glycerol glycerophosphotransferase family protein n=1 Tax=Leucobacter aridicollis TaxID=283878 RepID=UPI0021068B06|nr:CDP-glycerol glycerophosphotransferase family protein [Leucobacter aridicollis]UTX53526.1 CDP-glycerol glycerophosphotransferase family protein [Leucobacter aridicollis]
MRELRSVITTATLSTTRPHPRHATVVTLNADEENATVQAVFLGDSGDFDRIVLVTPSPEISRIAVGMAARRLELEVPPQLEYRKLSYGALLGEYRRSRETYSTHVLLPGRDFSKRRRHVHLTHGSGPKPDTTFRAPTNVLASITPQWVEQQLKEYKLPADTEVIEYMPRLEIMRRSVGDTSILEKLGLDPTKPLVVWAPTYRVTRRGREVRVSGVPLSIDGTVAAAEVQRLAQGLGATLVLKIHPHDQDPSEKLGLPSFDVDSLREHEVTTYELFGVADLVVTDYSSIYVERERANLRYARITEDYSSFAQSYRGLRY